MALPRLNLDEVRDRHDNYNFSSGRSGSSSFSRSLPVGSSSARSAEPPRNTYMSSNSYLATARELVYSYKERNGPGRGGLSDAKQRHRLRGFQTENLGLSRIDFKADKAAIQLPEYYRMKQEGINAVTSPRPGQPATESLRGNSTQIKRVPMKSHSYAGHLDLSHKKLGDDYTYAAIKALGTTVHRTDLDYLAMKELEKAFHTLSEDEESDDDCDVDTAHQNKTDQNDARRNKTKRNKRAHRRMNKHGNSSGNDSKHHRITHINLRDNRLSDLGMVRVIENICDDKVIVPFVRSIDVSQNNIRKKGANALAKLLKHADALSVLCLEKMQFNDNALRCLCRGLSTECSLTSLNLTGNNLSDAGAVTLAKVLSGSPMASSDFAVDDESTTEAEESFKSDADVAGGASLLTYRLPLKDLNLSWNEIRSKGAVALIDAIGDNNTLLKFDLSWNAIGTKSEATRVVAISLSEALRKNTTLIHLDLSQNHLSTVDCEIIGKGLKDNHTLLGIHVTGNQGSVDAYGNLVPDVSPWPAESGHVHVMSRIRNTKVVGQEKWMLRNNCWICGAHRETLFEYTMTLAQNKNIVDKIMADPAQVAVLEAKKKAADAAQRREEEKRRKALEEADPLANMFSTGLQAEAESQSTCDVDILRDNDATSRQSEVGVGPIESIMEIPEVPEFIESRVKLLTSFDKWEPEEMSRLKPGEKLSPDYYGFDQGYALSESEHTNTSQTHQNVENSDVVEIVEESETRMSLRGGMNPVEAANRGDLDGSIPVHNQCENLDSSRIMRQNRPFKGKLVRNRREVTTDDAYAVASSYYTFTLNVHGRQNHENRSSTTRDGRAISFDEEFIASLNKAADQDSPAKPANIAASSHPEGADISDKIEEENAQAGADLSKCMEESPVTDDATAIATAPMQETHLTGVDFKESNTAEGNTNGNAKELQRELADNLSTNISKKTTYSVDEDDNMESRQAAGRQKYRLCRMVPPGTHYYCFQVDDFELTFDPFKPHVRTASLLKLGLQGPLRRIAEEAQNAVVSAQNGPSTKEERKPKNESVAPPNATQQKLNDATEHHTKKQSGHQKKPHKPSSPNKSGHRPHHAKHRKDKPLRIPQPHTPTEAEAAIMKALASATSNAGPCSEQDLLGILPKYLNTLTVMEQTAEEKLKGPEAMFTALKPRIKQEDSAIQKKIWTWRDSIFFQRTHKYESSYLTRCFAKDWGYTRACKNKNKAEANNLENVLCKHFPLLVSIYAKYSCLYSSEFFMMGMAALNELVTRCNIIEAAENTDDSTVEEGTGKLLASKRWKLLKSINKTGNTFRSEGNKRASMRKSMTQGKQGLSSQSVLTTDSLSSFDATSVDIQRSEEGQLQGGPSLRSVPRGSISDTSQLGSITTTSLRGATRTEIELIFVSNTISGPKHEYNTKRALCRFQFLDVIIGLANVKFVKTNICDDIVTAVEKLIHEHLEPYAERLDGAPFREKYLYVQDADDVLRKHMAIWDKVYKNYSGDENTPLEERTMCFKEWNALCDNAELDADGLTERNMKIAYASSLYYYNDLFDDSNNFKKMSKFEFLECIIRAAHSMHLRRLGTLVEAGQSYDVTDSQVLANAGSTVSALSVDKSMTIASMPSVNNAGVAGTGEDINISDFIDLVDVIASKRILLKKRGTK